jgi:hypothetical protein
MNTNQKYLLDLKIIVFWYIMRCNLLDSCQHSFWMLVIIYQAMQRHIAESSSLQVIITRIQIYILLDLLHILQSSR